MPFCAAVICECNPFHSGHAYLFAKIREKLGSDTCIICIMSGNTVQRGEFAIYEKHDRAQAAIEGGADLVLELAHPFSCAPAPIFARKAVEIADSLGCISHLVFGSDCADIAKLKEISSRLSSASFENALQDAAGKTKGMAFPSLRAKVYEDLYNEKLPSAPNDTLALEYLSSLSALSSDITPLCIKRGNFESASEMRRKLRMRSDDRISRSDKAFLLLTSSIRLCDERALDAVADMPVGLAARMKKAAMRAECEDDYYDYLPTKLYTRARLHRLTMYAALGIKKSDFELAQKYAFVLASNESGRQFLAHIRGSKRSTIKTITSCSSVPVLGEDAQRLLALSRRCDALYSFTFERAQEAAFSLKMQPRIL